MGGSSDKVAGGQSFNDSPANSAKWQNDVSAAKDYYLSQVAGGQSKGGGINLREKPTQVSVKNLTGAARKRGEVVQLGDHLLTSDDDTVDAHHPWFQGNLYDASSTRRFAILQRAAIEDEIEPAFIAGRCVARVNVSDTAHRFAAPSDGETVLVSASSGPVEILSPLTATGEQEVHALICCGDSTTLRTLWVNVEVAAATFNYSAIELTPGITASAGFVMKWTNDPKMVKDTSINEGNAVPIINDSFTPIRASTTEPVFFSGYEEFQPDGTSIGWRAVKQLDIRSQSNFDKAEIQVLYHPANGVGTLDKEICATPP